MAYRYSDDDDDDDDDFDAYSIRPKVLDNDDDDDDLTTAVTACDFAGNHPPPAPCFKTRPSGWPPLSTAARQGAAVAGGGRDSVPRR